MKRHASKHMGLFIWDPLLLEMSLQPFGEFDKFVDKTSKCFGCNPHKFTPNVKDLSVY